MVEGFKHTDIGIIPNNWDVHELGAVASFRRGSFPQPYGLPQWYDENNGMPFVQVFDVDENMKLKSETKQKISDAAKDKSVFVPKDSIVLTIQGSIGRIAITQYDAYVDRTLLIFQTFKKPIDKWFFMYVVYQLFQIEKAKAPGGTIKTITKAELSSFLIPLPPTKAEQTAIATALNDANALIQKLEQLISKKQNIKTGAMQELLKPKEGWEEKYLTDYVEYIHGKAHEQHIDENGKYVVVNSKFISSDGTVVKHSNQNYCPAKEGDILTVLSDLPNGKALAKCFYVDVDKKYAVNQRICIWRSKGAVPKFLFYILNRNKYFIALDDGISQTHILNHHIEKCRISIPNDRTEQSKIAQILSDMDNEIQELEKQLEKYKMMKQGMMQSLLTGKIRLV